MEKDGRCGQQGQPVTQAEQERARGLICVKQHGSPVRSGEGILA